MKKREEFQLGRKVQFHQPNGQSGNFRTEKKGKKFRQEARNLSESSCSFFCCVESGNDGRDEAEHVE